MTTLTFHLSRSLARTWQRGDVIVVTQLDHDANIRPWVLAGQDVGAEVRFVQVHPEDGSLDEDDLSRKLAGRVRLVALTCASNAIGTMPDVARLTRRAHEAGALVFLDAVHYSPHGLIDVQAWDCDFLACSAYKFFGPHIGILWGRRALLEQLTPYKLRPATDRLPGKWMTGTQNHEGIAGAAAAIDYLASLGQGSTRRAKLVAAMTAIREHETRLVRRLLAGLAKRSAWHVWGLTREQDLPRRAPTVAITHRERSSLAAAEELARHGICVWAGNMYALELTQALGVESRGGFIRLGLVHYNTEDEVDRTLAALELI
jgi:cysteine desulfurase family protein (TIGR01976 family)